MFCFIVGLPFFFYNLKECSIIACYTYYFSFNLHNVTWGGLQTSHFSRLSFPPPPHTDGK